MSVSVQLAHPPEAVFAYISDPRNDPQWVNTTPEVVQIDGDGPAVGARYRFVQIIRDRRMRGTIEIVSMEPPRGMTFHVDDRARTYLIDYELESVDGGTLLRQTSRPQRLKGRMRWFVPILPLLTRRQLNKQMRALRAVLATNGT